MSDPSAVLVMAPNWLGDAVMALPAVSDVRHAFPSSRLIVAARQSVAELFTLVPFVDSFMGLRWRGRLWDRPRFDDDAVQLRECGAELAILLPNSFASAWLVRRAAVPERWGYAGDLRKPLLSRAIGRPPGSMHQGAYYQHLLRELGIHSGPLEPAVTVSAAAEQAARDYLTAHGWESSTPLVVFAPGAAYGTAKRWLPRYVADVASELARAYGVYCVLAGSRADAETTGLIMDAVGADVGARVVDAAGSTTIESLAGILSLADACVSNDSGAMHLAAAVGTPLVALFGPTNEYETAPLTRAGRRSVVMTHPVWCRPCMLRECPIDHRCMTGIAPARVYEAVAALLGSDPVTDPTRGQIPERSVTRL